MPVRSLLFALGLGLAVVMTPGEAYGEGLMLHLGVLGGLQLEPARAWVIGPFALAGPSEGAQVRLGVVFGLGDDGSSISMQLETAVLVNARLGARLYGGLGFGVVRRQTAQGPRMRFPVLVLAGLKRPFGVGTIFVEGALMIPIPLPPEGVWPTRLTAGVALSL